jgi:hypothetical protein
MSKNLALLAKNSDIIPYRRANIKRGGMRKIPKSGIDAVKLRATQNRPAKVLSQAQCES